MGIAVGLVRAYLELNGYFVLSELPVRSFQHHLAVDVTDLDIVAVRFPHAASGAQRRVEPVEIYLGLDPALAADEGSVDVIVGEVKEGRAELNPNLQRMSTVAFALRRIGCCPDERVTGVARSVLQDGESRMAMAPGLPCHVRLVAFGGSGAEAGSGVHAISLQRCTAFIEQRLESAWNLLGGLHFEDPVLGLFALRQKLREIG